MSGGRVRRVGNSDLLNSRSINSLEKILTLLQSKNIKINDLQFLIEPNGKLVIADPLDVTIGEPPSRNNIRMIRLLIEVAGENVLVNKLESGTKYSREQIIDLMKSQISDRNMLNSILGQLVTDGKLLKNPDGSFVKPPD